MINIDDRILAEADESQLFLLIAIAKHMGNNSKAWPSNKTLCKTTRWSESKLLRVKKSAIEAGLLGAEYRFNDNAQTSNLYDIKTRRIAVMVNLADVVPPSTDEAPPPSEMNTPPIQKRRAEVLTNEVLTNINCKADKPHPTPKSETLIDHLPVEDKKEKTPPNFARPPKKEKAAPKIHAENEPNFSYFSDPEKAKSAWTEWIEYKYSQHRELYKEAKTELAKLRQLFQQFNGDSTKFEAAINYSIGNLYRGIFPPKIENGNGKFQHLDKAQQQHIKLARFVADIHSGAAFRDAGSVDIITGE